MFSNSKDKRLVSKEERENKLQVVKSGPLSREKVLVLLQGNLLIQKVKRLSQIVSQTRQALLFKNLTLQQVNTLVSPQLFQGTDSHSLEEIPAYQQKELLEQKLQPRANFSNPLTWNYNLSYSNFLPNIYKDIKPLSEEKQEYNKSQIPEVDITIPIAEKRTLASYDKTLLILDHPIDLSTNVYIIGCTSLESKVENKEQKKRNHPLGIWDKTNLLSQQQLKKLESYIGKNGEYMRMVYQSSNPKTSIYLTKAIDQDPDKFSDLLNTSEELKTEANKPLANALRFINEIYYNHYLPIQNERAVNFYFKNMDRHVNQLALRKAIQLQITYAINYLSLQQNLQRKEKIDPNFQPNRHRFYEYQNRMQRKPDRTNPGDHIQDRPGVRRMGKS